MSAIDPRSEGVWLYPHTSLRRQQTIKGGRDDVAGCKEGGSWVDANTDHPVRAKNPRRHPLYINTC